MTSLAPCVKKCVSLFSLPSLASESGQKFRDAKAAWILDYISLWQVVSSSMENNCMPYILDQPPQPMMPITTRDIALLGSGILHYTFICP